MTRRHALVLAFSALSVMSGCSHRPVVPARAPVMVPPRVDLKEHEIIGVVEFSSSARGQLGALATKRFTEWARRDQGLVRFVNLGTRTEAMRSVGRMTWDVATFQALGEKHGIRTILDGELAVSSARPDIRIAASLRSGDATAQVDATLNVELIETATGASLWNASSRARQNLGHIGLASGGQMSFNADDPQRAYGSLVDSLVDQTTVDFRATWQ